jgi:RNA polymerase sigma factor (TIGR02999 family)
MSDVRHNLSAIEQGDPHAAEQLLPLVYDELRQLAAQKLIQEKPGQTLQATALIHEAYLRLVDVDRVRQWDSRGHFFAAAAEAMRRILVNRALAKRCGKRGGGWQRVELDRLAVVDDASDEDLLAIDEALERLAQESPPCAQLVQLRFFASLTLDEAAASLGPARRTAAGTTPFPKERFKRAADDEIRRIIREEEPPKPSTRLSESKDSLPSISAQRQTEPAKLTKLVRGELDWIVMKALEKGRNRRYETPGALAQDIERYRHDQPVQACPPPRRGTGCGSLAGGNGPLGRRCGRLLGRRRQLAGRQGRQPPAPLG